MRKFLNRWIKSLEESEAKTRACGYVVVHGAGVSYLIPLPESEITEFKEPNESDAQGFGFQY